MNETKIKLIDTTRKLDVLRMAAERSRDDLEIPVKDPDLRSAIEQYYLFIDGAAIMLKEAVRDLIEVEETM